MLREAPFPGFGASGAVTGRGANARELGGARPLRLLVLSYEYPPIGGGGGPVCEGLCEAFVAAGHEVVVVTSRAAGLAARERRRGVEIHRVWCLRRHRHYTTAFELVTTLAPMYRAALRLHRERPFDLSHTHFIVPSGLVAQRLHQRTGLPYVLTAHGSDVPGYNPDRFDLVHRLIARRWRRVVSDAAAVTVPSRFLELLMRERVSRRVEVVPNGFDPPPPPAVPRGRQVLLVSRLFERKGAQHLVEAVALLEARRPDLLAEWEVAIAGDGPYGRELEACAARLRSPVRRLGYVRGAALAELYHRSRIFVFPSVQENFPMVLLEAMAAGCAVVTTRAPGCAEVVGNAAVLVPPAAPEELADALERLMDDPAAVDHLGAAARRRAARFRLARVAGEYLEIFSRHAAVDIAGAGSA